MVQHSDILLQETIMFVCVALLVAFGLWLYFRHRQMRNHLEYHRLEVLNKLIDKYASSAEFVSFMHTEEGKRLFGTANGQPIYPQATQGTAVLRFIQVGVMLAVLGGGFLAQADIYGPDTAYWGIMCFMLAIGLWVIAAITAVWNWMQRRSARGELRTEAAQG